jgi:hypothetical protein
LLSLSRCRRLLGSLADTLSDVELQELQHQMRTLAHVALDVPPSTLHTERPSIERHLSAVAPPPAEAASGLITEGKRKTPRCRAARRGATRV